MPDLGDFHPGISRPIMTKSQILPPEKGEYIHGESLVHIADAIDIKNPEGALNNGRPFITGNWPLKQRIGLSKDGRRREQKQKKHPGPN